MTTFHVANNYTAITDPDPRALDLIDRELRYPTQTAIAMEQGFRPPDQGYGGWDGWIRLLRRPKTQAPYFPTGLLYRATGILDHLKVPYELRDGRERPEPGVPEYADLKLRDYQREAVRAAITAGRGVLDLPPRAGKTRLMIEVVRELALPAIWMAPTDRIVTQTCEVAEGYFGKHFAYRQVGTKGWEEAARHHIVFCTAATAVNLPEAFYLSRQVIVIDEFHHASAKTYGEIAKKCEHVYHRYGMTGTFFRSGDDELAMHGILSNVIFKMRSIDLLEQGYLVPTQVVFLPILSEPLRGVPRGSTYQTGIGKLGVQEHVYRQQLAANAAAYLDRCGRRTLCLVATKRQGRDLAQRIAAQVKPAPTGAEHKAVEFVSTDMDRGRLNKVLDSFVARQEVRILIGTSLLGEGVDLPVADALVYARGEKAEVSLVQNAYRVCTAMPGKGSALIVDFADRHHKKLLAHSEERLGVYHSEPIFKVEVLENPADFGPWVEKGGYVRSSL